MYIKQLSVNVQKKQLENVLEKTYSYNLENALKNNYEAVHLLVTLQARKLQL